MKLELPLEAARLAPQEPPLLLVSRLLACDGQSGVAEAVIDAQCVALDENGVLLPEALLELIAQAYALVAGYAALTHGSRTLPLQGMLVGMRRAKIFSRPKKGETVLVHVDPEGHFEPFVLVQGSVSSAGEVLALAELKLFIAPEAWY